MNQKSKLSLGVSLIDRRKQSSDFISVYRALPKIIPNYFTCGRRCIGGVGECVGVEVVMVECLYDTIVLSCMTDVENIN